MAYPLKVWDGTQWVQVSTSTQSNYAFATLNRWRKTMSGGEVSLTGTDASSLTLAYTAGEEQVFINGTLIVRGADYVATDGANITGIAPLASGDIVEVHSRTMQNIANTYTQSQADTRFVNKSVGGLNLVVPTSVTGGTVSANGAVTIGSAVSSVAVTGAFSSLYDNYRIVISGGASSAQTYLGFSLTGGTSVYDYQLLYSTYLTATPLADRAQNAASFAYGGTGSIANGLHLDIDVNNPFLPLYTIFKSQINSIDLAGTAQGRHKAATSFTGFTISVQTGTMTGGTIRIYGYNNGA